MGVGIAFIAIANDECTIYRLLIMDLLSPEEKEEVFGALGDVTDTFHKDTVTLVKFTKTATRMGTGKPGTSEETPLLCRVTKNSVPSDAEHNAQSVDDRNLIEIRFF